MAEIFEDFKNKALFLDSLGLNSIIKREKAVEPETPVNYKISLNEIIIIEDDEDESTGNRAEPRLNVRSKLLSKSQKATKPKDSLNFTKGLRGRSKKLLMLDLSSPLGRKIDFSCGKANKNKSPLDYVDNYEKWCCNYALKLAEGEQRSSKIKSTRRRARGDPKTYNFRRRSKRNNDNNIINNNDNSSNNNNNNTHNKGQLSKSSELLLRLMKPCSVVLANMGQVANSSKVKTQSEETILNGVLESTEAQCQGNDATIDDPNEKEPSEHLTEDELLIERVYSLAPGACSHLPSRLLDLGQSFLKSLASSPITSQHTADNSPPSTPSKLNDSWDLTNRLSGVQVADQNGRPSEATPCEGRNINIIDLCDVENDDCFMIESVPKNVRTANGPTGQPLQQVTQSRIACGKVANKEASPQRGDMRLLSFLCRICNEIIRCRGFYKADMVKHYAVKHNIANVNLVSHIHNGKLVWKVVEESPYFNDGSPSKCRKRRKENHSFSEMDRQSKMLEANVTPVSASEHESAIPEKDRNISANIIGKNPFSSDVICID